MKNNLFKKYFIPHEGNDHKPHFFREGTVAVVMAAILILFVTSFGSSYIVKNTTLLGNVYSSVLVDLTNESRTENNQKPLAVSPVLEKAAQMKADDMAEKSYFAHTSPEGITPWYWFKQVGYTFLYAGENLAVGYSRSEDVNQGWLNSPTHKANILNAKFTEIGIATAQGMHKGRQTTYVVQMFGQPKASSAKVQQPAPAKTAVAQTDTVPVVLAASQESKETEQTTEEIYSDEKLSIVKDATPEEVAAESESGLLDEGNIRYSTWYERALINQPYLVQNILMFMMILIAAALAIFMIHEFRIRHFKHFFYGLMLLVVTAGIMALNKSFIMVEQFIK